MHTNFGTQNAVLHAILLVCLRHLRRGRGKAMPGPRPGLAPLALLGLGSLAWAERRRVGLRAGQNLVPCHSRRKANETKRRGLVQEPCFFVGGSVPGCLITMHKGGMRQWCHEAVVLWSAQVNLCRDVLNA